jgi:hypothetical protein
MGGSAMAINPAIRSSTPRRMDQNVERVWGMVSIIKTPSVA